MQLFLNNLQSCLSSIHSYPDVFSVSPKASPRQKQNLSPAKVIHSKKVQHSSHRHECRFYVQTSSNSNWLTVECVAPSIPPRVALNVGWHQWQPPSRVWQQLLLKSQIRLTIFHSQNGSVQSSLGKTVSTKTTTTLYPPSLLSVLHIHPSPKLLNTWCFQNLEPPKNIRNPNTNTFTWETGMTGRHIFGDPL